MAHHCRISYELRHLRCFVAVAEELHFSRAARRLAVSQSMVSRSVRDLELLLGVRLFERSARVVTLTSPGVELLQQARDVLAASARLGRTAADLTEKARGTLVVGMHGEGAAELNLPMLAAFGAAEPNVRVVVRSLEWVSTPDALDAGGCDVVISGGSWTPDHQTATLFHDARGVIVGPLHGLHAAESARVADVVDAELFGLPRDERAAEGFFGAFVFADARNDEPGFRRAGEGSNLLEIASQLVRGSGAIGATASTMRTVDLAPCRFVALDDAAPVAVTAAIPLRSTPVQRTFLRVAQETAAALATKLIPTAITATGSDRRSDAAP